MTASLLRHNLREALATLQWVASKLNHADRPSFCWLRLELSTGLRPDNGARQGTAMTGRGLFGMH